MNTNTTTAKKTTTKTCDRCGKDGLFWKKSERTGRWFLAESMMVRGYTGRYFRSDRLHKCPQPVMETLNTRPETSALVTGKPAGPLEDPESHQHRYLPWRPRVGSLVTGVTCLGCRDTLVD